MLKSDGLIFTKEMLDWVVVKIQNIEIASVKKTMQNIFYCRIALESFASKLRFGRPSEPYASRGRRFEGLQIPSYWNSF